MIWGCLLALLCKGRRSPKPGDCGDDPCAPFWFRGTKYIEDTWGIFNDSFLYPDIMQPIKSSCLFKLEILGKVAVGPQIVLRCARSRKEATSEAVPVPPSFLRYNLSPSATRREPWVR